MELLQKLWTLLVQNENLILILVCFNIGLTALKAILDKVAQSAPEAPGSLRQKIHYYVALACEWLSKLIDWSTANKPH